MASSAGVGGAALEVSRFFSYLFLCEQSVNPFECSPPPDGSATALPRRGQVDCPRGPYASRMDPVWYGNDLLSVHYPSMTMSLYTHRVLNYMIASRRHPILTA